MPLHQNNGQKVYISFFTKLIICFVVISIVPVLALGLLAYSFSLRSSMRDLERQTNTMVETAVTNLTHTIEEYQNALSYFCTDDEIINILDSGNISETSQTAVYQKMYILLAGKPASVAMHVIKADGTMNVSTGIFPEIYNITNHKEWGIFRKLSENDGSVVYSNRFTSATGKTYCMTIAHSIIKNGNVIGYSIIDVPQVVFQTIFDASGPMLPASYTIIDQNYYVLYNGTATGSIFLEQPLRDKMKASAASKRLYLEEPGRLITWRTTAGDFPLTVISSVPVELVVMSSNYIVLTTVAVAVVAILFCLVLSPVLVHSLTRPLNGIVDVMKRVQKGDTSARVLVLKQDEFGFIGSNFNKTLDKLNVLYQTNLEKQNRLRLSELKALQAQINPHFLYNTLDSIKWLAKLSGVNDIVVMVSQLGRLLKNSIHNQNDSIQICEEITLVESYLSIQKIRYGEKFTAQIQVDDSILQCVVPKFIIQPLVENAIIHGIENKIGNANLMIKGCKKKDTIVFEIIDDGVGISEEQLAQLHQTNFEKDSSRDSIGIANVDKRIKLYYGEEYGLDIKSCENVGTITRITMPFQCTNTEKQEEACRDVENSGG
ncbi:sensor histidine kinase [Hydrogenoanaerobacterium sp.]|uniref:sensor histidine kinase n=1 Tax=Hydrogenoanaerobacterium sp. TaxID=2953763 RepID=UPI0028998BDA|nr:sensor histidine kinase [Hydrogenoanaerobacterium sp.]